MQIIDLSHEIHEQMTVFGEMESPSIYRKCTVNKDGYKLHEIKINSHTGTHVDSPSHMIEGKKHLSDFPLSKFQGKGLMLKTKDFVSGEIPLSFFKNYELEINEADFLLLNSGWYKKWETKEYHLNFPILSEESAHWLTKFNLKGIGLDTISIDPTTSENVPLHHIILGAEMLIIENLCNLDILPKSGFLFQCLPLKIDQSDGSTTRAVAFL